MSLEAVDVEALGEAVTVAWQNVIQAGRCAPDAKQHDRATALSAEALSRNQALAHYSSCDRRFRFTTQGFSREVTMHAMMNGGSLTSARRRQTSSIQGAFGDVFRKGVAAIAAMLTLLLVVDAVAAPIRYSFTVIAATDDFFTGFDGAPSINDSGVVAFPAFIRIDPNQQPTVTRGIFKGDGGPPTAIVYDIRPFSNFGAIPSINSAGKVAFKADVRAGAAVFVGDGGPVTTIALASDHAREGPSINDEGLVAFEMSVNFNVTAGLFVGSGGPVTPVVSTAADPSFNSFSDPDINNAGVIAFATHLIDGSNRIMIADHGVLSIVADTRDGIFKDFGFFPSISNLATVAFTAVVADGGSAIVTARDGILTTVVDTSTSFRWFGWGPDINDSGRVAFQAGIEGGSGVFTAGDSGGGKVIATGDPLFGSTVADLFFHRRGLNNGGDIAFTVTLADRRQLVVRASPIREPVDKDDCKNEGWRNFDALSFKNQGDCVSWVNKNRR